jgi:hypothetical protein
MPQDIELTPINTTERDQAILAAVEVGLGGVAMDALLAEPVVENVPTRDIDLDGETYQTNLPEGIDPFEDGYEGAHLAGTNPAKLDGLAPGTYSVARTAREFDLNTNKFRDTTIERGFTVLETPHGTAVSVDEGDDWGVQDGTERLLEAMDILVEGNQIIALPTPNTFKAAMAEQGVEVKFIGDTDGEKISGKEYLQTFGEGAYPVGTRLYKHDIEDDHATAMVLGGTPLRDGLQRVSNETLQNGDTTGWGYRYIHRHIARSSFSSPRNFSGGLR